MARCKVQRLVAASTDLRQIIKVTSAAIFYLGTISIWREIGEVGACGGGHWGVVAGGHSGSGGRGDVSIINLPSWVLIY